MSDEEEDNQCPLCLEELDITEKNFKPCQCGYQICRFCWNHIIQDLNNKCPACREPYSSNYQFTPPDPQEVLKYKSKKRKESKKKDGSRKEIKNRKHLVNMRVIQRNLVYVTNISLSIAKEEILRKNEYFGQYGPIEKVVINKGNLYNVNSPNGPSVSIYVTFENREDAINSIKSIDGFWVENRTIRASFGTTKYCSFFLRNLVCNNSECMYLHDLGSEEDIFSKEDISQGKHHLQELNQQNLHALNLKRSEFCKLRNTILPPPRFDLPTNATELDEKDQVEAQPSLGTSPETKSLASSSGAIPMPIPATSGKSKGSAWNNQPAPTSQSPPSVSSFTPDQGSASPPTLPASESASSELKTDISEKPILPPTASWGSKSTDKGVEPQKPQAQTNNTDPSIHLNTSNSNNINANNNKSNNNNNSNNNSKNEQYNNAPSKLFPLNEKIFEHSIFSTSPTIVDKTPESNSWNNYSYPANDDLLSDNWQLGSEIDDESEDEEEFAFKDMSYGFTGVKSRFQFANEEPELFPLNFSENLTTEETQVISNFTQIHSKLPNIENNNNDSNNKSNVINNNIPVQEKQLTHIETTQSTIDSNMNFKVGDLTNNANLFTQLHIQNQNSPNNLFDLDFHIKNAPFNGIKNTINNTDNHPTLVSNSLSNSNTNINININPTHNLNNSNLILNINSSSNSVPNNLIVNPIAMDGANNNNTNSTVHVNSISKLSTIPPSNLNNGNHLNNLQNSLNNLNISNNNSNNAINTNLISSANVKANNPFDNIDKNTLVFLNDKENNIMINNILQNNSNKINNNPDLENDHLFKANNDEKSHQNIKHEHDKNINTNLNTQSTSSPNSNNNNNEEGESNHFNMGFPSGTDKHQAFRALLPNVNVSFNISPSVGQPPEVNPQPFMFPTPPPFNPWNSFPNPHNSPILPNPFPMQPPPRNSINEFYESSNNFNNTFNNQNQFPKQFPPFASFSPFPPFPLHSTNPLPSNHLGFGPNQPNVNAQNQTNPPNQSLGPNSQIGSSSPNPNLNSVAPNGLSNTQNNGMNVNHQMVTPPPGLNSQNANLLPPNQHPNSIGPNPSVNQQLLNFQSQSLQQILPGPQQGAPQFFSPKFPQMYSAPINQGPFLPPGIQVPSNVAPPLNHIHPNQFPPHLPPNQPPGFPFSHFHSVPPDSSSFMENAPFISPYPTNQYIPR